MTHLKLFRFGLDLVSISSFYKRVRKSQTRSTDSWHLARTYHGPTLDPFDVGGKSEGYVRVRLLQSKDPADPCDEQRPSHVIG